MNNIVEGEHDWMKRGGYDRVSGLTAAMPAPQPMSNPFGMGGGFRGRLRDALLAASPAGHSDNRMEKVIEARLWDRGMHPDQQALRTGGRDTSSIKNMEYMIFAAEQKLGRRMTSQERAEFINKNWYPMQRGPTQYDVNGVPIIGQQTPDGGFMGMPAANTVGADPGVPVDPSQAPGSPAPEYPASPSEAAGIPGAAQRNISLQEAQRQENEQKEKAKYSEVTGRGVAELDNAFRSDAQDLVNVVRQQLGDAIALRDLIKNNPNYQNTGPWEQFYAEWSDEHTAEVKAASVFQTLMNLQITKLTPVSEKEIGMVSKLWASVANDPKGNVGALNDAIRRYEKVLGELQKKRDYWTKNGNSLKDYNLVDKDADWTTPLPSSWGVGDKYSGGSSSTTTTKQRNFEDEYK